MDPASLVVQSLVILQAAVVLILTIRIWKINLHRSYPYFFAYLILLLLQSTAPLFFNRNTNFYVYLYIITGTLVVSFNALIVLELYTVTFRDLEGIRTVSRFYIKIALGLSVVVSILMLALENVPKNKTGKFQVFEGAAALSLALFVLLITVLLVYYPIRLNRNFMVYSMGYAGYFLAKTVGRFISNAVHERAFQVSMVFVAVSTACLMFWLIALRRDEAQTVVIGHQWDTKSSERLLAQLKAINDWLLRQKPRR